MLTILEDHLLEVENVVVQNISSDGHTFYLDVTHYYIIICYSILAVIGVPGNFLSAIVFQKRSMHDCFISIQMTALMLADIFILIEKFMASVILTTKGYLHVSDQDCYLEMIVQTGGMSIPNWMMVSITASRLLSLVNSEKFSEIASTFYANVLIAAIVGVNIVTLCVVWKLLLSQEDIYMFCENEDLIIIRLFLRFFIATCPIACLTILSAIVIRINKKLPKHGPLERKISAPERKNHLGKLVMANAVQTCIRALPAVIVFHLDLILSFTSYNETAIFVLVYHICVSLMYSTYATNVFIFARYSRFRREVLYDLSNIFPSIMPPRERLSSHIHIRQFPARLSTHYHVKHHNAKPAPTVSGK